MSDTFDHEMDAWSSLDFENDGEPWWPGPPPTCKWCGKTAMQWVQTQRGWRLFDGAVQHNCAKGIEAAQRDFA